MKLDPQSKIDNDWDDEEIIDLTQVAEGDDDPVIDLTDILERTEPGPDPSDQPAEETAALETAVDPPESGPDVIELTDLAPASKDWTDAPQPQPITPEAAPEPVAPLIDEPAPDQEPVAGTMVAASPTPQVNPTTAEPLFMTDQQVAEALERVVRTLYGEKIEALMIQAVEKTVKEEIAKIKKALLEDDDGALG